MKALFALALLTSAFAPAQTADNPKPAKATKPVAGPKKTEAELAAEERRQKALDFLKRSHALNEQVDEQQKSLLLVQQINVAGRIDKELAVDWARELFDLGSHMEPEPGTRAQMWGVNALAAANPDEAMSLLLRIEPAFLQPSTREFPGANGFDNTFRSVFDSYVRQKGKTGMIDVLSAAGTLGEKGRYPYSGVMEAAKSLDDPVLAGKVAVALITRFQSRADSDIVSFDFSQMLVECETAIPKNLLKPAVDAAAEALQNYPINNDNKNFYVTMNFANGSVSGHGPVEIGLLRFAPLLKRVDPELAAQLAEKYSFLSQPASALDWKDGGGSMIMGLGGAASSGAVADERSLILRQVGSLIWQDPEKADRLLAGIGDASLRAEAYSYAARNLASRDPVRTARYADEAEKAASQVDDSMTKFRALATRLQADASKEERAAVLRDLEPTFRMADRLMRKAVEEEESTEEIESILAGVCHAAAKMEPDLTGANIDTIHLPFERARLLAATASELAPPLQSKKVSK